MVFQACSVSWSAKRSLQFQSLRWENGLSSKKLFSRLSDSERFNPSGEGKRIGIRGVWGQRKMTEWLKIALLRIPAYSNSTPSEQTGFSCFNPSGGRMVPLSFKLVQQTGPETHDLTTLIHFTRKWAQKAVSLDVSIPQVGEWYLFKLAGLERFPRTDVWPEDDMFQSLRWENGLSSYLREHPGLSWRAGL